MSSERRYAPTRFSRACFGESVDRVPVWMMRQAGRYMPEYQALRAKYSFLELCRTPAVAAQATLDAQRYLDTDAAIIFSDITIPAWGMGQELEFSPGPTFKLPMQTEAAIDTLKPLQPETDLDFVMEAIRITRRELPEDVSLIGFVGAPLTLAAYMAEGSPTRSWVGFKTMLYDNPALFQVLLDKVTEAVTRHAIAQIEAGCDAIQLFDSNAGQLAPRELQDYAFASAKKVVDALKGMGVPIIYFARQVAHNLEGAAAVGADVLGLDWSVSVAEARQRLGSDVSLMGNLDPTALFASKGEIERRIYEILEEAKGHPGFVFNLGHGILPGTPPPHARHVIESVRSFCAK